MQAFIQKDYSTCHSKCQTVCPLHPFTSTKESSSSLTRKMTFDGHSRAMKQNGVTRAEQKKTHTLQLLQGVRLHSAEGPRAASVARQNNPRCMAAFGYHLLHESA